MNMQCPIATYQAVDMNVQPIFTYGPPKTLRICHPTIVPLFCKLDIFYPQRLTNARTTNANVGALLVRFVMDL